MKRAGGGWLGSGKLTRAEVSEPDIARVISKWTGERRGPLTCVCVVCLCVFVFARASDADRHASSASGPVAGCLGAARSYVCSFVFVWSNPQPHNPHNLKAKPYLVCCSHPSKHSHTHTHTCTHKHTHKPSPPKGIPLMKLVESEAGRLLALADDLHQRIVGQHEAVRFCFVLCVVLAVLFSCFWRCALYPKSRHISARAP